MVPNQPWPCGVSIFVKHWKWLYGCTKGKTVFANVTGYVAACMYAHVAFVTMMTWGRQHSLVLLKEFPAAVAKDLGTWVIQWPENWSQRCWDMRTPRQRAWNMPKGSLSSQRGWVASTVSSGTMPVSLHLLAQHGLARVVLSFSEKLYWRLPSLQLSFELPSLFSSEYCSKKSVNATETLPFDSQVSLLLSASFTK